MQRANSASFTGKNKPARAAFSSMIGFGFFGEIRASPLRRDIRKIRWRNRAAIAIIDGHEKMQITQKEVKSRSFLRRLRFFAAISSGAAIGDEMAARDAKVRKIAVRLVIATAIALAVAISTVNFFLRRSRVAFAAEQIAIFEHMKASAATATKLDDARALRDYCSGYYPSGTKQIPGSDLDTIVELAPSNAIRAIDDRIRLGGGAMYTSAP